MNVIDIRRQLSLSKYAFAKKLDVSWNTVHFWERGIWQPNRKNKKEIRKLLKLARLQKNKKNAPDS